MTTGPARAALECSGELTIAHVEEWRDKVLSSLSGGTDLHLDCSGATEADLSFIQLVLGARASARGKGGAVTLTAPSDGALIRAARAAGLVQEGDESRNRFCTGEG